MGGCGKPQNLGNFATVSRGISRAGPQNVAKKFPRKTVACISLHTLPAHTEQDKLSLAIPPYIDPCWQAPSVVIYYLRSYGAIDIECDDDVWFRMLREDS